MSLFTIQKYVQCKACLHGEWVILDADRFALGVSFDTEEAAQEYLETLERGAAAERARIRRELLEEIDAKLSALRARNAGARVDLLTVHDSACIGLLSELRRAVDRIVPEEG